MNRWYTKGCSGGYFKMQQIYRVGDIPEMQSVLLFDTLFFIHQLILCIPLSVMSAATFQI